MTGWITNRFNIRIGMCETRQGIYQRLVKQTELADVLAARVLASVEEHAPGAAEAEGGAARIRIETPTGAGALLVGAAPAARHDPAPVQLVHQFRVEVVGVGQRQTLPRHRHDDDARRRAPVAGALLHQAQHLLLDARPTDHLQYGLRHSLVIR